MEVFNSIYYKIINYPYQQLLKIIHQKYQIGTFKFKEFHYNTLYHYYQEIFNKYQTKQFDRRSFHWYENQRRMFVWFAVCYAEIHSIENLQFNQTQWTLLSKIFFNKQPIFLEYQCRNILKKIPRKSWTKQQDDLLRSHVQIYGLGKWNEIAKDIFFKTDKQYFRTAKQCRQRWLNHLDKSKIKGEWDQGQDLIILKYVRDNGKKWAKIGPLLKNCRTEHMIKNRFKALITKHQTKLSTEQQTIIYLIESLQQTTPNMALKKQSESPLSPFFNLGSQKSISLSQFHQYQVFPNQYINHLFYNQQLLKYIQIHNKKWQNGTKFIECQSNKN